MKYRNQRLYVQVNNKPMLLPMIPAYCFGYGWLLLTFFVACIDPALPTTPTPAKEVKNTVANPPLTDKKPIPLSAVEQTFIDAKLTPVRSLDSTFLLDIRYATTNNFTKTNLYGSLSDCYLQPKVAEKLVKAQQILRKQHPTFSLLLFDCARPHSVQQRMWTVVKGTPMSRYVASPTKHSLHNYGVAVDLTLADGSGKEIDMGTPYDHLGALAQPRYNEKYLQSGQLTRQQVANRTLLRRVMTEAGFLPISNEWWHFEAIRIAQAPKVYRLIR